MEAISLLKKKSSVWEDKERKDKIENKHEGIFSRKFKI